MGFGTNYRLINSGESPEDAGKREAQEEAHLKINKLELVTRCYPSPGVSTEFLHKLSGIVSLPKNTNLVTGLTSEDEDIESHIFSFDAFSTMISKGVINVGPAILLGLWLSKNRRRLMKKYC